MQTGKLNKRIQVLRPPFAGDQDEAGQPLNEYQPVARLWASIEPLRGRELFAAQQANAETTVRIRLRYHAEIDRTMIVRYGASEFEVLYTINPEFGNKELQLMCKERQ